MPRPLGIAAMGLQNDLAHFQHVRTLDGHASAVSSVKFDPLRGTLLLSVSADRTVKLWKHDGQDLLFTGKEHEGGLNDVCWMGKCGSQFATASDDKTLVIWDTESQKRLQHMTGHTNYVFSVKGNREGNMLVSGSFDESLRVWDVRTGTSVREIPAHGDPITSVDWSHDGETIVSGSYDGLCRVWSARDGRATKTIVVSADRAPVTNVQFTPNGRFLLISTLNDRITIRKYLGTESDVMMEYIGHSNRSLCLIPAMANSSREGGRPWLICGSEDHSVYVWSIRRTRKLSDVENAADAGETYCQRIVGRKSVELEGEGHCGPVLCAHAHPKAATVVTGSTDSTVKIWTDVVT